MNRPNSVDKIFCFNKNTDVIEMQIELRNSPMPKKGDK